RREVRTRVRGGAAAAPPRTVPRRADFRSGQRRHAAPARSDRPHPLPVHDCGDRARHAFPVFARRANLGDSLGTGRRARHAARAALERVGAALQSRAVRMMLEVTGIDAFYGETQALFEVSLAVDRGEVLALLGLNGAGKTTTLRAILGLTPARKGRIAFAGDDITRWPTHR